MENKSIKVAILKHEKIDIDKLKPFQGELKKLSDENFNKLRKQIIDTGFAFMIHVWECAGSIYIIDGHQRCKVLTSLRKEGYEVPPIDCAFVEANDFKDAKQRVFQAVSQYGKLDEDGFKDFVGNDDFDFLGDFDFPDFTASTIDAFDNNLDDIDDPGNKLDGFLIELEFPDEPSRKECYEDLISKGLIVRMK